MHFIVFTILFTISGINANDVLGCGGFIKSHIPIDFSKVEVTLYTKQGILKDKTNCAPNNGYYFIPLYDKGDYVLQLEPPAGWSFDPTSVKLAIDGKSDACSQGKDINFVFKGFGITGRVESFGTPRKGPSGVTVQLVENNSVKLRSTLTNEDGSFFFTPVFPGIYTVKISHPKWRIFKNSVQVELTVGNTEVPLNSLVVLGYDVKGAIKSDREPVKDVAIVLFKHDDNRHEIQVEGCDFSPLSDFKVKPLCHVKSNDHGEFIFPTLSPGHYYIAPFYKGQNIHFEPSTISFLVQHESVTLVEYIEIVGFSISGLVLDSENGNALIGATVLLNNKKISVTDKDGRYTLEKIKAGTYKLKVLAENLQFEEKVLKVYPSLNYLPDFVPKSYKVCGTVISDKPQPVTINKVGSTFMITTSSNAADGMFCEFLGPGKYQVQVTVSNSDQSEGIQFYPLSQTIEVKSKPITNIMFSQLKATVSGKVQCLREKDCLNVKVVLKQIVNEVAIAGKDMESIVEGGDYTFVNVRPGNYEVIVETRTFCWKSSSYNLQVNSVTVTVPPFIQTGYAAVITASHAAKITYKSLLPNKPNKSFEIKAGRNEHCVEKAGVYDFSLESCHTFDTNTIQFNTDSENNEVFIIFKKHLVTFSISSEEKYDDVSVDISIDGKLYQKSSLLYKNKQFVIEFQLDSKETAQITPKSSIIFFNPPTLSIQGQSDCVDFGKKFTAIKGIILEGKIIPPLAGVLIKVESDSDEILTYETDAGGKYKFPPLDASRQYKISAQKNSYIMKGPDKSGNFLAHKLAEIIVHVVDESNQQPLTGALVSLSGGESYRSNLQTDKEGLIVFHSLSPSEYFLRPVMKEYIFEPSSKIINIEDGVTERVRLHGKRVAYSAFGVVMSLNGETEAGVVVAAIGARNCSHFSEETVSEYNGHFRIRGLQPSCSYEIKIKEYLDHKNTIERTIPNVIIVNSVKEDITGLKIILFNTHPHTDILVHILAVNPDHYKTLRVKISKESTHQQGLHTIKLDSSNYKISKDYNSGVLIQVPSVQMDNNSTYSVQLESTLPQINRYEPQTKYFVANSSFKFIQLSFVVKANLVDQQIKQTSILTLFAIFGIMFTLYNIKEFTGFLTEQLNKLNIGTSIAGLKQKPVTGEAPVDPTEIDQIVQSINAVKRKTKPRKI